MNVNTGNAPAVNATILGTDLLNVDLSNGYNEIPFTYTGGLPPVLYLAVTNGNGQAQQYTFSLDNIFVGTVAGDYTLNKIEYVADYFPYGKILREFVESDKERFLTTQHERDAETGMDYRGARYYDADVARFLSTDPWQDKYPSWSTYNYVMSNPLVFIDPTGMGPEDPPQGHFLVNNSGPRAQTINNISPDVLQLNTEKYGQDYVFPVWNGGGEPVITYSETQFKKYWANRYGVDMTSEQVTNIRRGCIGVTACFLNTPSNPAANNAFANLSDAQDFAELQMRNLAEHPEFYFANSHVRLYSIRFYTSDENAYLPDESGRVNMQNWSGDNIEVMNSSTPNFDYGYYDHETLRWWHANHQQSNSPLGNPMMIYHSTLEFYSKETNGLNRQVFVVDIYTSPPSDN